jgi:multisubunit Na+/H+ antiporter MnhB subunit
VSRPATMLSAVLAATVALALAWSVVTMPHEPGGLTRRVDDRLADAGASHPVTAVLLDFRAYDTWLEVGVLLLAVLAVLAIARLADARATDNDERRHAFISDVAGVGVPLLVLIAGLLLWLGSHAPGGAFQAGAVLAAAGIVVWLNGRRSVVALHRPLLQLAVGLGFIAFLVAGVLALVAGRALLDYPPNLAADLIIIVELGVALSVGAALALLFVVGRPR